MSAKQHSRAQSVGKNPVQKPKQIKTPDIKHQKSCPLKDPQLGIVSENDHRVGTCLCQYCTCGKHACPSLKQRSPYPLATYRTKYANEFTRKRFDIPLRQQQKRYAQNSQRADFLTTNQREFQAYAIEKKKEGYRPLTPNIQKFTASSVYSNEFQNWGPNYVQRQKHLYRPVRETELRFLGESSYAKGFQKYDKDKIDLYSTNLSTLDACRSTINIGSRQNFNGMTTNRREFQDYSSSGTELNYRIRVKTPNPNQTFTADAHFQSTTGNNHNYIKSYIKDPRQYKSWLTKNSAKTQTL